MEILQLKPEQLTRKILDLLCQLSSTKKLTLVNARLIVARQIKKNHLTYVGYLDGEPIAIGSVIISERLIHDGLYPVALLEDIVVKKDMHGQGYGKLLVNHLVKVARKFKCYKAVLDCNLENVGFYLACNFQKYCEQMRMDLLEID